MNLCPCGARGDAAGRCSCAPERVHRYREKLSRALLDRFDLSLAVPRPRGTELAGPPGEPSSTVASRVEAARGRLAVGPPRLGDEARELLTRAVERLPLSGRGRARVARVASSIAALAGAERIGPEHLALAVFAAETGEHLLEEPKSRRFERFRQTFDEDAYRRRLAADGLSWVGRDDAAFPQRLLAIHDPPVGVFVRGAGEMPQTEPTVAIVGARACSSYGTGVAKRLARELAAAGVIVVSGLARGIDGAAHRGALETGTTLAVLGCGIDREYPRAHASLAAEITAEGWVVSEYAPGVEPAPWRFPARNRIVAGLGGAAAAVEAGGG